MQCTVRRCHNKSSLNTPNKFRWAVLAIGLLVILPISPAYSQQLNPALKVFDENVTVSVRDASVEIFLRAVFANTNIVVVVDDAIKQRVSEPRSYKAATSISMIDESAEQSPLVLANVTPSVNAARIEPKPELELDPGFEVEIPTEAEVPLAVVQEKPLKRKAVFIDSVVERTFILTHAHAADLTLSGTVAGVVPGAAARLKKLVEVTGLASFEYQNQRLEGDAEATPIIVASKKLNAIVVTDRLSRMPMYEDFIEAPIQVLSKYPSLVPNLATCNEREICLSIASCQWASSGGYSRYTVW